MWKVLNHLVCAEPDDWGVGQDGDEHLGLKEQVGARHFEGSGQSTQTPGQGMEHLVENHLTCTVILDPKEIRQNTRMYEPWDPFEKQECRWREKACKQPLT